MSGRLSPAADATLGRFLDEVRRWGARTNLVGSISPEALERHVSDSLAAASGIPRGARLVDLGSGAGFPGIPLAIVRADLEITLVEIRERRFHFLRHVVRTLGLCCEVLRSRVEDPPETRFELALMRAVAPPEKALALGRAWVEPGGEVWIWARERPQELPGEPGRDIPLGERGLILRVPAAAVSRGTLP